MKRTLALVLSLAVAALAVAGFVAASKTIALGSKAAEPTPVAKAVVVKHRRALDRWAASLHRSLVKKPPPLPKVPHYPKVDIPAVPAWTPVAYAQPVAQTTTVQAARPAPLHTTQVVKITPKKPVKVPTKKSQPRPAPSPVTTTAPATTTAPVLPVPAPPPVPTITAPTDTTPTDTGGGGGGGHGDGHGGGGDD